MYGFLPTVNNYSIIADVDTFLHARQREGSNTETNSETSISQRSWYAGFGVDRHGQVDSTESEQQWMARGGGGGWRPKSLRTRGLRSNIQVEASYQSWN